MSKCCICNNDANFLIHAYGKSRATSGEYYFCEECRIKVIALGTVYTSNFIAFVVKEQRKKKLEKLLS